MRSSKRNSTTLLTYILYCFTFRTSLQKTRTHRKIKKRILSLPLPLTNSLSLSLFLSLSLLLNISLSLSVCLSLSLSLSLSRTLNPPSPPTSFFRFSSFFSFLSFHKSKQIHPLAKTQMSLYLPTNFLWSYRPTHNLFSSPLGVMANVLDCDIAVKELEPQSRYYVHFWTNILGKG